MAFAWLSGVVYAQTPTATLTPSATTYVAAGGTITFTTNLSYSGSLIALGFSVTTPAGWSFVSDGGNVGSVKPDIGRVGQLDWGWITIPASPVVFTFTVHYPAGLSGDQVFSGINFAYRVSGIAGTPTLPIANVTLVPRVYHSADTNRDEAIGLSELLRVIQIYNYRNGTIRTGEYTMQAGSEDGFTPGVTGGVVTAFHSADTNHDGKLSLTELLRVGELYNYRSGSIRTGQLHRDTRNTEDGFAPGP